MMRYNVGPLLKTIDSPIDLRQLNKEDLPQLANEMRQYLIDVISEIGNSHFSASLGVIELTIALHYVFNTPKDLLVWDVGHQAYGHKILTGRRTQFPSNRTKGGLSGFPTREESEYDVFGVGHASTSISAILGMAVADRLKGNKDKHHIAVIGDGAMTGGMAFEGLNHTGFEKDINLLVVLNDNCMSIDPNVGALKEYLISISKSYQDTNLFEALDFQYFGPVDGHDLPTVLQTLEHLKKIKGPKILHCITKKGKGYKYSEEGIPSQWHAPGVFNKFTGEILKKKNPSKQPPKYQIVFGETLLELAQKNDKIIGITPAMPTGSSLNIMMEQYPERTFDVGIAEQHAVTFAAGLSTQGFIPFCVIYSTFLQRAYDQVIHDVALQNLPVIFCLDRAGLVGADGATHHGSFDLAYLRCIPNLIIAAPTNEHDLRNLMFTAQQQHNNPFVIRYPRGRGVKLEWRNNMEALPIGKGRKVNDGKSVAIISIGHAGNFVQDALTLLHQKNIHPAHYDLVFLKPLDEEMLHEVFQKFTKIITVEDGCINGGMGSAILEFMAQHGYQAQIQLLGIPDRFIHHATQEELWEECGYDTKGIVYAVEKLWSI